MGIFGDSRSQANTTNTSTNTTTVGTIGLTGADAVAGIVSIGTVYDNALSDLTNAYNNTVNRGYAFSQYTIEENIGLTNLTAMRFENSLANITNATRDFTQRSIAAGTGQATPLQNLEAASGSGVGKLDTTTIILIGLGILALMK